MMTSMGWLLRLRRAKRWLQGTFDLFGDAARFLNRWPPYGAPGAAGRVPTAGDS
jgi:hypothetical protein